MAQVRNKTELTLWVPELGRTVEPGQVVDVPDERLDGYVCQPDVWADETVQVKKSAKKDGE